MQQIPGFRSRTWWKMVIAVAAYSFIGIVLLSGIAAGRLSVALLGLFMLVLVLLATNGWGLRSHIPIMHSSRRLVAASGWLALSVFGFVGISLLAAGEPNKTSPGTEQVAEVPRSSAVQKPADTTKPPPTARPAETPKPAATVRPTDTPKPSPTPRPTETPKPTPTSTRVPPTPTPAPAKETAKYVDPRQLSADPNAYKGVNVLLQGMAVNVQQQRDYTWVQFLAAVRARDSFQQVVVEVRPKEPSILNEECYCFYGVVYGTSKMTTVLTGASQDMVTIRAYAWEEQPRDEYGLCIRP